MNSFTAAGAGIKLFIRLQLRLVADNWMVQLQETNGRKRNLDDNFNHNVLPCEPSSFLARHHFPDWSMISRMSPFWNVISLGSSGFAVSCEKVDQTKDGK